MALLRGLKRQDVLSVLNTPVPVSPIAAAKNGRNPQRVQSKKKQENTEHSEWRLAPAFDMTYAYRPSSEWTAHHQMTINGKRDNFTLANLLKVAEAIKIKNGKEIIDEMKRNLVLDIL